MTASTVILHAAAHRDIDVLADHRDTGGEQLHITFAHYKANHLMLENPKLVADFAALEAIIGPLERSTPNAPLFS